jgi:hypothetical protein
MTSIDRPAARRTSLRHLPALAAALAVAALVAPLAASPARAAWEQETPVAGAITTRPAIAMDTAGHLGVAWQLTSNTSGILFATDASGTWATTRVSDGDDSSPDVAYGASGAAHVVYVRFGTGAGLYYATNASGSWVSTLLRADPLGWSPSIAVDAAGKLHVAYSSEGFTPGIYHYTNAGGTWAGTRVTTSTWDCEPSIAIDPSGTIHIAFARYEPASPGIYVRSKTSTSTAWTESRVSSGPAIDDYPSLGIDASGKSHIAFLRFDADWNGSLWYATNASGTWVRSALAMPGSVEPGSPSIGFDGTGAPEVVAGVSGDATVDTLYRFHDPGLATAEALIPPGERLSGFPDILRDAGGRLTVAYRNAWHEPGLFVHREDPDETTAIAGSTYVYSPVVEGRADLRYLVVDRYAPGASDGTTLATKDAGTWSDTTLDPGIHGAPDLGVVGSAGGNDLFVTNPQRLLWDEGDGWKDLDFSQKAIQASLAIDFDPSILTYPVVAYTTGAGIRMLEHGAESQLTADGSDANPDLAVSGTGGNRVLAFVRGDDLYAMGTTGDMTIDAVSDTGWTVDDADPGVGPTLTLPGAAQRVCLNDSSPTPCPADATLYGHPGTGWNIDLSSIPGAAWIWAPGITGATSPSDNDTYTFTRTISVPFTPTAGIIRLAADDGATVTVNGHPAGSVTAFYSLTTFDITSHLVVGNNTIVVTGTNGAACGGTSCPYSSNPGGVVMGVSITYRPPTTTAAAVRDLWTAPQLVDGTSAWDPAVAISEHSGTFIAYDRQATNPGIYLARGSAGSGTWAQTRLSRSWADSRPAIATKASTSGDPLVEDDVYVAWVRECSGAAPGIYLARNGAGWTWTVTRVVASCDVGDVSIDLVDGKVVLAYGDGASAIRTMSETSVTGATPTVVGPAAVGGSTRPDDTSGRPPTTTVPAASGVQPLARPGAPVGPDRQPGGGGHASTTP